MEECAWDNSVMEELPFPRGDLDIHLTFSISPNHTTVQVISACLALASPAHSLCPLRGELPAGHPRTPGADLAILLYPFRSPLC